MASQAQVSVASSPRPPILWCLAVGHLPLLHLLPLHQALQHQARATTRNLLAKATRFRLKWRVLAAASAPLIVTAALAQPMCQLEPPPILMCILQDSSSGDKYCALACILGGCPSGSKCVHLSSLLGVCIYPDSESNLKLGLAANSEITV